MNFPLATYKPGYLVYFTMSKDEVTTTLHVRAELDCAKVFGAKTVVRFERSIPTRLLNDRRVLMHWTAGVIAQFEMHEMNHWIKFDGKLFKELMRDGEKNTLQDAGPPPSEIVREYAEGRSRSRDVGVEPALPNEEPGLGS